MFSAYSKYQGRSKRPKIGWGLAAGSLELGTCSNFGDMLLLTGPFLPPFHPPCLLPPSLLRLSNVVWLMNLRDVLSTGSGDCRG